MDIVPATWREEVNELGEVVGYSSKHSREQLVYRNGILVFDSFEVECSLSNRTIRIVIARIVESCRIMSIWVL